MYVCVTFFCWRLFHVISQIWYGTFYIWGIDAIKFLWKSGEGVGARTKLIVVSNRRKLLGSKVLDIYLKLSMVKKISPKTTPHPKKRLRTHFQSL